MPKQLINIIGIVVCIGILVLAIAAVALPIYLQSIATNSQTASVAQANNLYQIQVDSLRAEEERMPEIEASVASLRDQIPATNELDEVFELVADSAAASDVEVLTITAGENAAFTVRTAPLAAGEEPAPAAEESTTESSAEGATGEASNEPTEDSGEATTDPSSGGAVPADERQQVDFTITVSATQLGDAIEFLDLLRGGPRLLTPVQSTITPTGTGFDISVSALTYVLPEN